MTETTTAVEETADEIKPFVGEQDRHCLGAGYAGQFRDHRHVVQQRGQASGHVFPPTFRVAKEGSIPAIHARRH